MLLSFDNFRAHFDKLGTDEKIARSQLELLIQLLDPFVGQPWGEDPVDHAMGITQTIDSSAFAEAVESNTRLTTTFDQAASGQQEGKENDRQDRDR